MFRNFRQGLRSLRQQRPLIFYSGVTALAGLTTLSAAVVYANSSGVVPENFDKSIIDPSKIPQRKDHIKHLKEEEFDLLIIGGGATGAGIAVDAATRGLKVALVERGDFSSGTSSRSTKLIHGGVRYLEQAVKNLDIGQLDLVREALHERKHLIGAAPHLTRPLPIIVPFYDSFPMILFSGPYYYAGVKAYDLFAGKGLLEPSYWITHREAREKFPTLKEEGLKGGVVYYDGQFNDSRFNVALTLTAAAKGATLANYVEVSSLLKTQVDGKDAVSGAHVVDKLSGQEFDIKAKMTINAAGPFSDHVRHMADPSLLPLIKPSAGVHVVVSDRFAPKDMGLIIPKTADGRVLFSLPWQDSTIVGTTDSPAPLTDWPRPKEQDIDFILTEVSRYLQHPIRREDVDSAWAGIRPLAIAENVVDYHKQQQESGKVSKQKDTKSTSRDHVIENTYPGLISIAGGKWTTYRKMAEDAVDRLLQENKFRKQSKLPDDLIIKDESLKPCHTHNLCLVGGGGWSPQIPAQIKRLGFDEDVATHLAHSYGDAALQVAQLALQEGATERLANGYPFIEAEVLYACRYEYAQKASDVLAHRTRLSFLNEASARTALPKVLALCGKELGWDHERKLREFQEASLFLNTFNRKENLLSSSSTSKAPLSIASSLTPSNLTNLSQSLKDTLGFACFTPDQISTLHKSWLEETKGSEFMSESELSSFLQKHSRNVRVLNASSKYIPLGSLSLPSISKAVTSSSFMEHGATSALKPSLVELENQDALVRFDQFIVASAFAASKTR